MIQAISKRNQAGALLKYLLGRVDGAGRPRERVVVLGGTVTGSAPSMAIEFAALRRLRLTVGRAIVHCSLRLAPGAVP